MLLGMLVVALLGGGWLWHRYSLNPDGVVPYPYTLPPLSQHLSLDAPLLITGDRMGARLALFKEDLSVDLSVGLSKPLKVQSIAKEGYGLHRTLRQLESLDRWPRVLLFQGGSEEWRESKFLTKEIPTIRHNFDRYSDDTEQTLLIVWPSLARCLYQPIARVKLPEEPVMSDSPTLSDDEFQARLDLTYRLFEMELRRLVDLARDHQTLLILTTTPVNLDIPPRHTCANASTQEIQTEISAIRDLIRQQDYKSAYARSHQLVEGTVANAEVFYVHGQVARRAGLLPEAASNLQKAAAYDCSGWRASEITNNIIRKVASEQRVTLFDFARMLDEDWNKNTTFFNEIYPQDLYYQRGVHALALVLRRLLKL